MTRRRRLTAMRALAILFVMAVAAPAHADLKVGDRVKELDIAVDASDKPFKLKAVAGWRFVSANAA